MTRNGGNMADPGSVAYLFNRKGVVIVSHAAAGEDAVLDAVLDAGAEEVNDLDVHDDRATCGKVLQFTPKHLHGLALSGVGMASKSGEDSGLHQEAPVVADEVDHIEVRLSIDPPKATAELLEEDNRGFGRAKHQHDVEGGDIDAFIQAYLRQKAAGKALSAKASTDD